MDKIATKEALTAVAQALSDKIAQQDYIKVPILDENGYLDKNLLTTNIKHQLLASVKSGLWRNMILTQTSDDQASFSETRFITAGIQDDGAAYFVYYDLDDAEIKNFAIDPEDNDAQ